MDYQSNSFGETLRRRREQMGLSLNDVAVRTRVRKTYLQALEEENLTALPGSAYAIGFLRIYARHLDLAVEPLVTALTGRAAPDVDRKGSHFTEGGAAAPRRRARRGKLLPLLLVLLLLAVAGGGYLLYLQRPAAPPVTVKPVEPPPPAQPPVTAQVPPLAPAAPAAPAATAAQGPEVTALPVLPPEGAVVRAAATGAGVMKVTLDGQDSRDYELQPGQKLTWKVGSQLQLELSAPALIRCWVNEQEVALAELVAVRLTVAPPKEAARQ